MRSRLLFTFVFCLTLVLSACSPKVAIPQPTGKATTTNNSNQSYPAPGAAHGKDYPAPTPLYGQTPEPTPNYPAPAVNPGTFVEVVPFKLNKPIVEGATEVTGTGPANIPIILEDISFFGEILGQTVIKEDGTFSFKVSPMEKDHRLGLTTNDLKGTKWSEANFEDKGFYGDEPRLVPNVGFFYDTTNVQGK
jgi:hypothetical protein